MSNPVTAVLLSFRGYDTLLELAALLAALLGILALAFVGGQPLAWDSPPQGPTLDQGRNPP